MARLIRSSWQAISRTHKSASTTQKIPLGVSSEIRLSTPGGVGKPRPASRKCGMIREDLLKPNANISKRSK